MTDAFAERSFIGLWRIQHNNFPQEYFGELSYDPVKGHSKLTLYGISISVFFEFDKISAITGTTTTGKSVSVFDLIVTSSSCGSGGTLNRKTVFSFTSFCVGNECFSNENSIRLRKYSFRCTNLESWAAYRLFSFPNPQGEKRSLGEINIPDPLIIYEDPIIRIKLSLTINRRSTQFSTNVSYYNTIDIEAKGNRKLPYCGQTGSISYYENAIFYFLGLMIGKHALAFNRIGVAEIKRLSPHTTPHGSHSKVIRYPSKELEFFNNCKIDESWSEEIRADQMLLIRTDLDTQLLLCAFRNFLAQFSRFDFILDDWMAMRNKTSYTNYSLPELIYNVEGLHRALYPECNTENGYLGKITEINAISSLEKYTELIKKRKKYDLPLRQRLQDILLIKAQPVYSFLSVQQCNIVIDYLMDTRNNAAHRDKKLSVSLDKWLPCILLCEELIAIMVFLNIGFQLQQINDILQKRQEWRELKRMLLEEFG